MERLVNLNRAFFRPALLLALGAALALSGCGRKGPLDPPPAASLAGEEAAQKPAGPVPKVMDSRGRLITPPGPNKPLPIDVLLN
jgi:predicted small lipoprotein YifL